MCGSASLSTLPHLPATSVANSTGAKAVRVQRVGLNPLLTHLHTIKEFLKSAHLAITVGGVEVFGDGYTEATGVKAQPGNTRLLPVGFLSERTPQGRAVPHQDVDHLRRTRLCCDP